MMKLLPLFLGLAVTAALCMSLFDSNTNFSKYHADIDGPEAVNFTANPPVGKTGAPFESACTDCHTGSTLPAAGTVDFSLGGFSGGYYLNQTYPVTISSASGTKNGFQLVAVDGADAQAGTFTAGTNSNISSSSGRDYVRQTSAVGSTAWTFDWTSPSSDIGDITFYYSYNVSNDNSGTGGDEIYVGSMTISVAGDVSITEYDLLAEKYTVAYNAETKSVIANYTNPDNNRIVFVVQNMNGQMVANYDLGYKAPGDYQEIISLGETEASGMYMVSVFLGNQNFTKKVFAGQ